MQMSTITSNLSETSRGTYKIIDQNHISITTERRTPSAIIEQTFKFNVKIEENHLYSFDKRARASF